MVNKSQKIKKRINEASLNLIENYRKITKEIVKKN